MISGVVRTVGLGMVAALLVAGCEGTGTTSHTEQIDISVDPNAQTRYAKSSRMYQLAKAGTVKMGVKFDEVLPFFMYICEASKRARCR